MQRREALGYNLAQIYAALDEKEQAFAWLEKDFQARSGQLQRYLAYSQEGNILRDLLSSDPRWNDLLQRTALPLN